MEESNVLIAMRKGYPCIILCDEKLGGIGTGFFCHNLKEFVYEDVVSPIKSRIDGGTCFTSEPV